MASKASSWVSGFLIGGAIGVGVALLSAPQSGEMTRFMIGERGKKIADQVRGAVDDTRDQAEQTINDVTAKVQTRAGKLKEVGQEVLDDQRQVIERTAQRAKRILQEEGRAAQASMDEQRDVINKAADAADEAFNG